MSVREGEVRLGLGMPVVGCERLYCIVQVQWRLGGVALGSCIGAGCALV